ncbi:MAG: hypothetical protein IKI37_11050, partial [Oscillospiraceae bacterium]|nr:hypothetical protein [Oscillospiraceae bacterium]
MGIGCIFPDAPTFTDYWKNIVEGKNSVRDISGKFWKKEDFYDADMFAEDKFYTTTGAYVDPIEFDTLEFGIPPKMLESTSVEQLFALIVAKQALIDAGMYEDDAKESERMRTGVIISSGLGSNGFFLCHRTEAPKIRKLLVNNGVPEKIADRVIRKYKDTLPDWDKDCTPGFISNVVAGRISNRFNLGGITASVDAACGSSLGSIKFAVDELRNGSCDCMLAGGINLSLSPHSYMMFCKTPAIAKSGMIKPFDESADGMILGDGAGIVVLKRLEDAKRDGNKIYAVICEVGASSDARARSIYAPSKKGQIRCLNNAYTASGIAKETIGLIEAHGTGTVAGDTCEVQALSKIFATDSKERNIILGSVKSQIGHLRLAAGISGFIKTAIALHEKVLPSSINVSKINKEVLNSNLCVLKKPKAWIVNDLQPVRRAGVSAFGFGGTNFHVILEEAESEHQAPYRLTPTALAIAFSAPSLQELSDKISAFRSEIKEDKYAFFSEKYNTENAGCEEYRLSFIAVSCEEALKKSENA